MLNTQNTQEPIELVAFNIIMDDLALPDGTTHSSLLGGGGPQTAFGMRLWSDQVGIFASVGEDLPQNAWTWLRGAGINTRGLLFRGEQTLRARQQIEPDGQRAQTWLVPQEVIQTHFNRSAGMLPPFYRTARGFHLGIHAEEPDWDFIRSLRKLGVCLSLETFRPTAQTLPEPHLARLLKEADIFSCNLHEGRAMTGLEDPLEILRGLLALGGRVVSLRMGAEGSLAVLAQEGKAYRFAAYPATVVDALGAGNAYCGGFLSGWLDHDSMREAGARGAAAASFLIEQIGLPTWKQSLKQEARRRADYILEKVEEIPL